MVARITTPNSIQKALNYNEKKVQKGIAECLYAGNFLKEPCELNFYEKLAHFKRNIDLNTRAKTNTLHISLNFDPSEKPGREKLNRIATAYMDKIGFGGQPYLVYEHRDAGHPHLHIVTTSIQENGRRIVTQNIGRNQSEKARKEIENDFNLVKASGKKPAADPEITTQKIQYGKNDTKRAINNALQTVLNRYHLTSLPELNAVLKLYNLQADSGEKDSRIFQTGGLVYRVLNDGGKRVGVPIKASSLSLQPTLKFWAMQFKKGEERRMPYKQKLKTSVEFILSQKPATVEALATGLKGENIAAVLRKNEEGFVYGITFIDHRTGAVFNGSDLGKELSAASLQKRINENAVRSEPTYSLLSRNNANKRTQVSEVGGVIEEKRAGLIDPLFEVLKTEKDNTGIPYGLRKKKKKKRGFNL